MTEEKKLVIRNGQKTELTITNVNQNLRTYLKQLDRDVLKDFINCPYFSTLEETIQFALKKESKYR